MPTKYDVLLRKYGRVRTVMMVGTTVYFLTLAFFLVFSKGACAQVFNSEGGVSNVPLKKTETKAKRTGIPKPNKAEPQETARLVPPTQTSGWDIHTQADPTDPLKFFSCIAVPRSREAAPVRVILTEKGSLVIMIVGIDFEIPEDISSPGAFRIDKGSVYQLWARAVPTTQETLFFLGEPNSDQLQEFERGRILSLVTNAKLMRVDLTTTKGLIVQLQACNAQGQDSINKEMLDKSKPVE